MADGPLFRARPRTRSIIRVWLIRAWIEVQGAFGETDAGLAEAQAVETLQTSKTRNTLMSFLGVYKAVYAYEPQSEGELLLAEDDILYLLEKSDVDDWWTVKKRVVGADVEEPVGLVPSNYIEPADIISTATALFDYDRQTDEELSFKEGEIFQVYDDKDPDWVLVSKGDEYGFAPANYIELRASNGTDAAPVFNSAPLNFAPPPAHPSLSKSSVTATPEPVLQPPPQNYDSQPLPKRSGSQSSQSYNAQGIVSGDEPPTLPSKPRPQSTDYNRADSYVSYEEPPAKPSRPAQQTSQLEDEDNELYTWAVHEVDGRKKKKAMLAIGNGNVYFSPDAVNGGSPQQWKAKDLLSFSSEKKHLFLEFKDPLYSLEIHSGTKEVAAEILTVLGEMKGAVSQKGLKEIKEASSSKGKKRSGKILYSFEAEGSDELTVREGDMVTIVNDTKSKDWWLVKNTATGKSGVVPSQFVQLEKEKTGISGLFKSLTNSKSKENLKKAAQQQQQQQSKRRDDDYEEASRLARPKTSRIRTWEDRSGSFKVEAEFLGVVDGKIHLHKTNGVKIAVDAKKLSLPDLEYVERVTGMSLDTYKAKRASDDKRKKDRKKRDHGDYHAERERLEKISEREHLERERDRRERDLERREREMDREERERLRGELADTKRKIEQLPPSKPARPDTGNRSRSGSGTSRKSVHATTKPEYDWFEFFLESGVDVNQCNRYSNNFNNEQIDPSILPSVDASVLRTLGLREGDIIRVMKNIDQKFNRKPAAAADNGNGGLFTDASGALKVNRTGYADQVTGSLPSPTKTHTKANPSEDDAWTVKPAANSEGSTPLQSQQFTGSMQDLVNLKPLEPTKTSGSARSYAPTPATPLPPAGTTQPVQTGTLAPMLTGTISSMKTGSTMAPALTGGLTAETTGMTLDPFKTGGGNILPLSTGGFVYLPIQQTGFIAAQGLMPLQRTGGLVPLQRTGGMGPAITGGLMPLQRTGGTGGFAPIQNTGGFGQPTFGMSQPLITGGNNIGALPQTSFGQGGFSQGQLTGGPSQTFGQPTGGLPQFTGGLPQTFAGGFQQFTGGLPQTYGQSTGGFPQLQQTGSFPQTSFGSQPLNSQQPTSFGMHGFQPQQINGNNFGANSLSSPPTFNTGAVPQFGQQMGNLTASFQNTGISSPFQQQQFAQGSGFGLGFGQVPQTFGQAPQQTFGQPVQPNFTGFGQPQQTSFGGFSQQPLEAQPTGFGFGNNPGVQKADLSKASAENPFGF